jgi:hypothetical protein
VHECAGPAACGAAGAALRRALLGPGAVLRRENFFSRDGSGSQRSAKENGMADQQQGQQINIELGEKEAEGIYSNLAIITHSPAEFIIDFTRVLPGVPKAKVHARVIMTAQHAKLLLRALEDNIGKFEMKFGEIKIHGEGSGGFGFQPVMPDEKVH